jgi:4-nitrophenyl phosphatase
LNGFIIDLDGTLYRGNEAIPYAEAFIRKLLKEGLPFLLVTNNSSRTPSQVAAHLGELGIAVSSEAVYTSSQAAAQYLQEHQAGNTVAVIGENGLRQALEQAGFIITDDHPDTLVQGIDRQFNYDKLAAAVQMLGAGTRYVMTNPDHLLPSHAGLMPGAGSLGAAIQAASGVEPVIIGKPSPIIMNYAIRRLGLTAPDVWVIGDNMATDIRGGALAGCRTALVLTGLVTRDRVKEHTARAGVKPDLVCEDLNEFSLTVLGSGLRLQS